MATATADAGLVPRPHQLSRFAAEAVDLEVPETA